LFIGIGSGVGLCVGPIYLSEIAPPRIGGNVGKSLSPAQHRLGLMFPKGVLTQLAIVLGIMITQAVGLRLATPAQWRIVLFLSFILSAAQLLLSPVVAESPAWLEGAGRPEESAMIRKKLWRLHIAIGTSALNISLAIFMTQQRFRATTGCRRPLT
jgi:MFS family permease